MVVSMIWRATAVLIHLMTNNAGVYFAVRSFLPHLMMTAETAEIQTITTIQRAPIA